MPRAWLMLAAGENRQHAGNRGYNDEPDSSYEWDSTVANHAKPKAGDLIALWDKKHLLGVSAIRRISSAPASKERLRCPFCGQTKVKRLKTGAKSYYCYRRTECGKQFAAPQVEQVDVIRYRTDHQAGWQDLAGLLDKEQLRKLCIQQKSIQSIRELRYDDLLSSLQSRGVDLGTSVTGKDQALTLGGHKTRMVRARVGQAHFRAKLLATFGEACAITGRCPQPALEAAHLYSYAAEATHYEHGGLLLRRDVHRLFDLGLIGVEPANHTIFVSSKLSSYVEYTRLTGTRIHVEPQVRTTNWLALHWSSHFEVDSI